MPSISAYPLPAGFPPTDTIYHRAPSGNPTSLLLLLPGNPGLISYYTHFLRTLSPLLPNTVLFGASHAGFTPSANPTYYTLREQVSLKLQLLRHVCAEEGVRDVVLVGHSMGAWIGMEMLRELGSEGGVKVRGMVGMFPTVIEIAESKAGRMMGVSCFQR